jgi:hypothetical protein
MSRIQHPVRLSAFALVVLFAHSPTQAQDEINVVALPPGEIRVGRPKVWLYDRLYPNLDGLLRDTEGISLASLNGLDANALNARVVDFLQSVIQASVNADQTAGLQNAAAESIFKASQGLLGTQTATAQALSAQKLNLLQSLTQAIDAQQKRIAALPVGTTCANDPQCQQAQQNVTDLNTLWTALGNASTAVGTPGTLSPPTLNGVTATPANPAPAVASIVDPKSFLATALGSTGGSLPPREQLENFITLLNDRLTKQLALSLDEDGLRGNYVPVVTEFDVSINPRTSRKDQTATVEFQFASGEKCGPPIVYNLYPSLSAFNVAEIQGKSSAFMLNGGFKGLFLGGSGSYQREHDRVSQALRQSVYLSGFRHGQSQLGWVYRPPAFTNTIRPGMYSTFAVVLVPRGCGLRIGQASHWTKKNGSERDRAPDSAFAEAGSYSNLGTPYQPPKVIHVQYDPHYASADDLQTDINVITVDFERPINPNLMIAAAGKLLKRVRDWRGRATVPGSTDSFSISDSAGVAHQVSRARGLFEADIDEADTWIAVTQTKIMLKLKYATVGSIVFPEIRLLTPGNETWALQQVVNSNTYEGTVTIGQREFLACHPKPNAATQDPMNQGCMRQPASMWLPLFVLQPSGAHTLRLARTFRDAPDNSGMPGQIYFFLTADDGRTPLSPRAQVVLTEPGHSRFPHPIPVECSGLMGGLLCHTHPQSMLYGAQPCRAEPMPGNYGWMLNIDPEECKIERYSLLRVEVTQPGSIADPTLFAQAMFPWNAPPLPVVGAASGFIRRTNNLHFMFPVYGLTVGAPVELRIDGTRMAGTAAVIADAASATSVLTVDVPNGEAGAGAILKGPVHLYSHETDLGPLVGMADAIEPDNVQLTIQGRFYQFSGAHLESVSSVSVGDVNRPVVQYRTGLLADIGDVPEKDSLLYFGIAGVKWPVSACVDRTKTTDKPASDASPKVADNTAAQPTKAEATSRGAAQSAPGNSDAVPALRPTPGQTERVCGPIVVPAVARGAAEKGGTAPTVMTLRAPVGTAQPANALVDAAKHIFLAPEPVRH